MILYCIIHLVSCDDSDKKGGTNIPYDPSKPVELGTFYPDSGKYLEKVILTGSNFGTDASKIKVYFNSKEAAVIGSTGEHLYVLAPRLPGDLCNVSVVVGKDSLTYPDIFKYTTSITVTTIAGNGNGSDMVVGSLSESIVQPWYVCVDNDDNVFVVNRVDPNYALLRIDEENDEISTIVNSTVVNVPCVDPETGIVSMPTETTIGSFITCDPLEYWAPRIREMRWPEGSVLPQYGWKHSMVVNPSDGCIYTRYYFGDIVKINPKSYDVEVIYKTDQGDSFGLTFNPLKPNILYMSFWSNAGNMANSICSIDVTDPERTYKRETSSITAGGHRDGKFEVAQFRQPGQIYCDSEGNMYVADSGNHCIRRISPEGTVETVLGMPGTAGWKDGTKEEALFNTPRGLGISKDGTVYVADTGNNRVRKLSIN
ncbi:MAG: IPT/TIG domain-containing protein [Bacteroidales bacterium]|nr:IPT/TIG domain-containing protein [Bacteroidales bacterium]